MAEPRSTITDLPVDILDLIVPFLDAKSFLQLTGTCRAFHQPSIRLDPAYWSRAVRTTFRVPNQPVVQRDGIRWQTLYRRLLTQSQVFTWGANSHGRLGVAEMVPSSRYRPYRGPPSGFSFPTEMDQMSQLGVIADLQCGGWSTTVLTSTGKLYTAGVINAESGRVSVNQRPHVPLTFPSGYPQSDSQYAEPTTAIRQFSAGRSHILGLSDNGRLWSWAELESPGLQVKFAQLETSLSSGTSDTSRLPGFGHIGYVVAGWSCSSAYIHGVGIVLWEPISGDEVSDESDTVLVLQSFEVPQTRFRHRTAATRRFEEDRVLAEAVGEVLNYVILENYVVFVTDVGKVFCSRLGKGNRVDRILELRALRTAAASSFDIQGSFRRFAIFQNGEVVVVEQSYLDLCWNSETTDVEQSDLPELPKIPALQHNDVISIAFGDYHFLALHASGKITAYGKENQGCGALGLGCPQDPLGRIRGVQVSNAFADGVLLAQTQVSGRQVWFRPEQRDWIVRLLQQDDEPAERIRLCATDEQVQMDVSEWIEQESKEFDKDTCEDGLPAYFALRISAAGWHSGAVVLVNAELASKPSSYDWQTKTFPRLKLSDGRELPGTKPFDQWREGIPQW